MELSIDELTGMVKTHGYEVDAYHTSSDTWTIHININGYRVITFVSEENSLDTDYIIKEIENFINYYSFSQKRIDRATALFNLFKSYIRKTKVNNLLK